MALRLWHVQAQRKAQRCPAMWGVIYSEVAVLCYIRRMLGTLSAAALCRLD